MPTLEQDVEAFGRRHGYSHGKARQRAENLIRTAVSERLAGRDPASLDRLPDELRQHAHEQFHERLAAGESAEGVRIFVGAGTWGR